MKKVLIISSSPRKGGNSEQLCAEFMRGAQVAGNEVEVIALRGKKMNFCLGCEVCQKNGGTCVHQDDVPAILDKILACDVLVLATPVYSWYCTPPMKALLDRLVYGMDKYYGAEKGPALWAGKALALLLTCGYRPERGCDLFEEGMRRYCKHAQLRFLGSHAERHLGYDVPFMDAEKEARTRAFARELWDAVH